VVYCCGSVVTVVFHCARLTCPLLVRRDDRCAPGLGCSRGDALPMQTVVEDVLTEDVPSSIVGL
jgi:hypothetical protein